MCRKRLSSPRCRSEVIDAAWVVIVPGQKCIKKYSMNYNITTKTKNCKKSLSINVQPWPTICTAGFVALSRPFTVGQFLAKEQQTIYRFVALHFIQKRKRNTEITKTTTNMTKVTSSVYIVVI